MKCLGDGPGGFQFPTLGALAVAEVEGAGLVVASGEGGADGRVHASGEADDGPGGGPGASSVDGTRVLLRVLS